MNRRAASYKTVFAKQAADWIWPVGLPLADPLA